MSSDEQAAEEVVLKVPEPSNLMLLLFWRAFLDGPARGGLHSNREFTFTNLSLNLLGPAVTPAAVT